jgi:glucose-1-phosphate thymidylyltransferase
LLDDGTCSNAERRGTIGDLMLAIESQKIDDDTLVICSDKMFGFTLYDFVGYFKKRREAINACFDTGDVESLRGKHGCVVVDAEGRIVEFEEKPSKPKSTIQSIAFYIFPRTTLPLVREYLEDGGTPDAPGFLLQWLCRRIPVYAWLFSEPCYDVGTPESYRRVDQLYQARIKEDK